MLKDIQVIDPQIFATAITVLAVLAGTISFHLRVGDLEETVRAELQTCSAQILNTMNARFDSLEQRFDEPFRSK